MVAVDKGIGSQENGSKAAEEEGEKEWDTPFVDNIVGNGHLEWEVQMLGDEPGGGVERVHDDGIN